MSQHSTYIVFDGDDEPYFDWLSKSTGLCFKRGKSSFRSDCIASGNMSNYWT
ncbi:hypothetical protein JOD20_003000 [Herpetosiphon giganteus]|nr:hypothetical protein [Herpetosiphon giganteus]